MKIFNIHIYLHIIFPTKFMYITSYTIKPQHIQSPTPPTHQYLQTPINIINKVQKFRKLFYTSNTISIDNHNKMLKNKKKIIDV
jgi:hypothetical protein